MSETNIMVNDEGCGLKKGDLLYKYTDLGEFTDIDPEKMKTEEFKEKYTQKIGELLQGNKIWFSKYERLNDPYEVTGAYYNYSNRDVKSYMELSDRWNRNMVEILSLTYHYKNLLMWSHYAKNHKGYCIEFEVEDPSKIFKVQYLEKMPEGITEPLYFAQDIEKRKEICKYFLYKSKVWEYENEYRVINIDDREKTNKSSVRDGLSIKLDEIGIKVNKIILGANCNKYLSKCIVADCSKYNVPCVRAKICRDKYNVKLSKKDLKKEFNIQ